MKSIPKSLVTLVPDIGRDSGGIYRHISREFQIPDPLKHGETTSLSWFDICSYLSTNTDSEKLLVNMLDTAIINCGIVQYLFTSSSGLISKKGLEFLDITKVKDQFSRIHQSYTEQPSSRKSFPFCCLHLSDNESKLLTVDEFDAWCSGLPRQSTATIQCYVPSNTPPNRIRTYQTGYWLDRSGQVNMKTDRVDISNTITGSKANTNLPNMRYGALPRCCFPFLHVC